MIGYWFKYQHRVLKAVVSHDAFIDGDNERLFASKKETPHMLL